MTNSSLAVFAVFTVSDKMCQEGAGYTGHSPGKGLESNHSRKGDPLALSRAWAVPFQDRLVATGEGSKQKVSTQVQASPGGRITDASRKWRWLRNPSCKRLRSSEGQS